MVLEPDVKTWEAVLNAIASKIEPNGLRPDRPSFERLASDVFLRKGNDRIEYRPRLRKIFIGMSRPMSPSDEAWKMIVNHIRKSCYHELIHREQFARIPFPVAKLFRSPAVWSHQYYEGPVEIMAHAGADINEAWRLLGQTKQQILALLRGADSKGLEPGDQESLRRKRKFYFSYLNLPSVHEKAKRRYFKYAFQYAIRLPGDPS